MGKKNKATSNSLRAQYIINSAGLNYLRGTIHDIKKLTVEDKPPAVILPVLTAVSTDSPSKTITKFRTMARAFLEGERIYGILSPNITNMTKILWVVDKDYLGEQKLIIRRLEHTTPFIRDPMFTSIKCQTYAMGYTSFDEDRSEYMGIRVTSNDLIWVERGVFEEVPFERDEFEDKVVHIDDVNTRKREYIQKYQKDMEKINSEKEEKRKKFIDSYIKSKKIVLKKREKIEGGFDEGDDDDDFGVGMDDIGSSIKDDDDDKKKKKGHDEDVDDEEDEDEEEDNFLQSLYDD